MNFDLLKWPTIRNTVINFNMPGIWQTMPESSTMKQNVRFQVEICPEQFQLHQIQNGQTSVIINFNMPDRSCKPCQIA